MSKAVTMDERLAHGLIRTWDSIKYDYTQLAAEEGETSISAEDIRGAVPDYLSAYASQKPAEARELSDYFNSLTTDEQDKILKQVFKHGEDW